MPSLPRHCLYVTLSAATVVAVNVSSAATLLPQGRSAQSFRAGTVLIPVDVRVLDGRGEPVTDLRESDFEVLEDGAVQEIALFSKAGSIDSKSRVSRKFVFVLGRGRLNVTGKGIDVIIDFVRHELNPADLVGVIAYYRTIGPTEDHQVVLDFLARFKAQHEQIESKLRTDNSGPAARVSPTTEWAIDRLFEGSAELTPRLRYADDRRISEYSDHQFLEHAIDSVAETDGEKQLVFVSERLVPLGQSGAENMGLRASTGRVVVSMVHIGGPPPAQTLYKGRVVGTRSDSWTASFEDAKIQELKKLTRLTGGVVSLFRPPSAFMRDLSNLTKFSYVLGYYSAAAGKPGYHEIRVKVRREGLTLHHRAGYERDRN